MTPPEEGGTWISSGQIYTELRRIGDEVSQLRIELVQVPQLRAEVIALRAEVETLKGRRWPLPSATAAIALAALGLTLYETMSR